MCTHPCQPRSAAATDHARPAPATYLDVTPRSGDPIRSADLVGPARPRLDSTGPRDASGPFDSAGPPIGPGPEPPPVPVPRPAGPRFVAESVLRATPAAVNRARSFTGAWLAAWRVDPEATFAVRLVVSELVTNSLVHSGTSDLSLRLSRRGARIHVEVVDHGQWRERAPKKPDEDPKESGRGLLLVSAIAEEYGVDRLPSGTRAWALVPAGADHQAPEAPQEF